MKVVAFNGSPRKNGNTSLLIETVFSELQKEGIETEMVQVGGSEIRGCLACGKCRERKDKKCVIDSDIVNECVQKMIHADGILFGSPVYFSTLTPELKALIDRAGYVVRGNGHMLARKVGASVAVGRRGGHIHTLDSMNHFMLLNQMMVPGSTYWNMALGGAEGSVLDDEEGITTMRNLGKNMAWLLKKLEA